MGRWRRVRSIRTRLGNAMLLIALVPLLVVGTLTLTSLDLIRSRSGESIEDARAELADEVVGGQLAAGARQVTGRLEVWFSERFDELLVLGRDPDLVDAAGRRAGTADARAAAAGAVASRGAIVGVGLTDPTGRPLVAAGEVDLGDDVTAQGWWQAARREGLAIGPVRFVQGRYEIVLASAVGDPEGGDGLGVLVATISTTVFFDAADDHRLTTAGRSQVIVHDESRQLLAETESGNASHRMLRADLGLTDARRELLAEPYEELAEDEGLPLDHVHQYGRYLAGHDVGGSVTPAEGAGATVTLPWAVTVLEPRSASIGALAALDDVPTAVGGTIQRAALLVGLLVLAVGGLALAAARLASRRITDPLGDLQAQAQQLADERLPEAMLQLAYDPATELPPVSIDVDDDDMEIRDLADALTSAAQAAVDAAQEQARAGNRTAELFVSLGRRNQNLIGRQLDLIETMEGDEEDPDRLGRLFDLDSLATRMRRNAESLLVIAGEVSPQTWAGAVPVPELVRAAASEVEDYRRVTRAEMEPVLVRGDAVADAAHLLAELIENALRYSPPTTAVWVGGRRHGTGYAVAVSDQGIGLSPEALEVANAQIAAGDDQDLPTDRLGLYVVARLARRLRCRVQLVTNGDGQGTTAWVLLPPALLREPEAADEVAAPHRRAGAAGTGGRPSTTVEDRTATTATVNPPPPTTPAAPATVNPPPPTTPAAPAAPTAVTATAPPPPPVGVAGTTPSGLVRRQPRRAAAEQRPADEAGTTEDPAAVQERLRAFQSSVARGRAASGAPTDQDRSIVSTQKETTP